MDTFLTFASKAAGTALAIAIGAVIVRSSLKKSTFLAACLAAAVIAICAVVVLNKFQKPVETAFATSAVRI
jgi:hypothetical protein